MKPFPNLRAELDYVTAAVDALGTALSQLETRQILDAINALFEKQALDTATILAAVQKAVDIQAAQSSTLATILAELSAPEPETGAFNPILGDPTMSVLQMTIGDAPYPSDGKPRMLTFSEPGAPTDGAVAGDNDAVATMALNPSDRASWIITLTPGGSPGVVNFSYSGTSDPPDSGAVVVEPLVLTVVALPSAETGQFNP